MLSLPEEIRNTLPEIFRKPRSIIQSLTDRYYLLVLLGEEERTRVAKYLDQKLDPYPGLIMPPNINGKNAFSTHSTKNMFLESNTVINMFSFNLGTDSTIVLHNHHQSIKTKDTEINYTIDLAYLIFFGNEITRQNFTKFLEDLVAFSFKIWRSQNAENKP